ncbi:MAG: FIST N-terminal domain-containing protein [Planctomycetota bacterium]
MQVCTLLFTPQDGWSAEFPPLDSPNTLVLVFGASGFVDAPEPIQELRERFPQSVLAGCSSSGEVLGDGIRDGSLVVAISKFASTKIQFALERIADHTDSQAVGAALASRLDKSDLRGVIVLSDGLGVNGTDLVRGLTVNLPDDVVATGGLAGDGDRFERTWVLSDNGTPRPGLVTVIGLSGESVKFGHGSRGGWDSFGPERKITRAEGNVLYELDGRPALDLYRDYLGERAEGLPATGLLFPLAIRRDVSDENVLVRTILGIDDEHRSMTFAGDLPQGWQAQLMKANFDRLIDGAADAALLARRDDENATTTLAIAISCVGRRLVLGERAEEEIEAVLEGLPPATQQVGFYSYGEISPNVNGKCDLHNQTMTLTTIQETD